MASPRLSFTALFAGTALAALLVLVSVSGHRASASLTLHALPFAVLVSLPFALVAAFTRIVSWSGSAAGLFVASAVLAGAGWPAWLQLGVALAFTVAATRVGRARNSITGLLDDGDGRGGRSVTANAGLAACVAFYAHDVAMRDAAALAMAAVLTAGACDSVASEIGKAFGGRAPIGLVSMRRVPSGTPGAVSLAGTMGGILAASVMAVCAAATGLVGTSEIPVVATAAISALLLDSVLAGLFEPGGWLDNDGINLLATCGAAIVAIALHAFRA